VGLIEAIGSGPVALDTCVFIYFIEEHPDYLPSIEPLFAAMDAGRLEGVTSTLTPLEVLVVPYRSGNRELARQYDALLGSSKGLRVLELDRTLLRTAAELRARFRIKTPDAIQLATALIAGCTTLITNDREIPSVPGMKVLQLGDAATRAETASSSTTRPTEGARGASRRRRRPPR
jgi:predicted nucleic acid-binding protein